VQPLPISAVADAVWVAHQHQHALVDRLPRNEFRNAEPNEGHLIAAALLIERAFAAVMTLNFDLAFSHALAWAGARGAVSVIEGPSDHVDLGIANLIYLHRNASAPAEQWILRTSALADEWRGTWQEALATRVLTTPVTVFAGLGTPAAVLLETVHRIRGMLNNVHVFQADVVPREASAFFGALGIEPAAYIRRGWVEFMRELSSRLTEEQLAGLALVTAALLAANHHWHPEEVGPLLDHLKERGLLVLGQVRARWVLSTRRYLPRLEVADPLLADLVLAIALMERLLGAKAVVTDDGIVDFRVGARVVATVLPASGSGVHRWLTVEGLVKRDERRWRYRAAPRWTIVAAVPGGRPNVTLPQSVVGEAAPVSVIRGDSLLHFIDVDALRAEPQAVTGILG
jgi:hypothetical protein